MFKECLENVRKNVPLVHNITNYVTVNDVANVLLACGGSPIMSDDIDDVVDITSICGGLNINIGTLNKNTIPSMFAAGKKANELGHVVLLDPVGAGASALRTNTANELMEKVKFDVVRGNISEVKTLMVGSGSTKGVDADVADKVTDENGNIKRMLPKRITPANPRIISWKDVRCFFLYDFFGINDQTPYKWLLFCWSLLYIIVFKDGIRESDSVLRLYKDVFPPYSARIRLS